MWRLQGDAFGEAQANEDPDGNWQPITFNLRFPGQYYDSESRLHYNYFRYYDPTKGRYITSDPIGLEGGMNTYAYAGLNSLIYIDPRGLSFSPVPGDHLVWPDHTNTQPVQVPLPSFEDCNKDVLQSTLLQQVPVVALVVVATSTGALPLMGLALGVETYSGISTAAGVAGCAELPTREEINDPQGFCEAPINVQYPHMFNKNIMRY